MTGNANVEKMRCGQRECSYPKAFIKQTIILTSFLSLAVHGEDSPAKASLSKAPVIDIPLDPTQQSLFRFRKTSKWKISPQALLSSSHRSLRSNPKSSPCVADARMECSSNNGKKIYVCHYDADTELYESLCVAETGASGILKNNEKDYCGECIEDVAFRFWDILGTTDNSDELLNAMDPKDLHRFVEGVRSYAPDGLKDTITTEAVLDVFFPHPDAVIDLSDLDVRRELTTNSLFTNVTALEVSDIDRDLGVLDWACDPFDELVEGLGFAPKENCCSSFAGVLVAALFVGLEFIGVRNSKQVAKGVVDIVQFGRSSPMVTQVFAAIELAKISGQHFAALKLGFKLVGFFFHLYGMKFVMNAIFDQLSAFDLAVSGAQFLLKITAFCTTGWVAAAAQVALLVVSIANFIDKGLVFVDACLERPCWIRRLDEIDCDDGDMCTADLSVCESGEYSCTHTTIECPDGFSCSPFDGECKRDDELIPCVAVIDEDDSFYYSNSMSQYDSWLGFREAYPARPFCLLVPNPEGSVDIPTNFESDDFTIVHYDITRDNGNVELAEDWLSLCGLNFYTSANVGYVGLFIDDSGSMREYQVAASRDKFFSDLNAKGIEVKKVVNTQENWILPFTTTLVPAS